MSSKNTYKHKYKKYKTKYLNKSNNAPEYKLFVWIGVLSDYTNGIAFSIATTKEEAIENLLKEYDRTINYLENKTTPDYNSKIYSDFGTIHYATKNLKNVFKKELQKKEPIVYDTHNPMAIFNGGGS